MGNIKNVSMDRLNQKEISNYKLKLLSEFEREFAFENHNLVYGFLRRYGYSLENYYDIAIFGYLKAVQVYNRREDLQYKYDFPFICWQYIRSEIGNYNRTENALKRKPETTLISLDAEYSETENFYNCTSAIDGKSPEMEILEMERMIELLNIFSDTQRKIIEMKIDGYSSKEIYSMLEMKPSTYYMEVKRIKKILEKVTG